MVNRLLLLSDISTCLMQVWLTGFIKCWCSDVAHADLLAERAETHTHTHTFHLLSFCQLALNDKSLQQDCCQGDVSAPWSAPVSCIYSKTASITNCWREKLVFILHSPKATDMKRYKYWVTLQAAVIGCLKKKKRRPNKWCMLLCTEKILTVIAHCVNKRQRLVIWHHGLPWSEIESVDVLGLEAPCGATAPPQTLNCLLCYWVNISILVGFYFRCFYYLCPIIY